MSDKPFPTARLPGATEMALWRAIGVPEPTPGAPFARRITYGAVAGMTEAGLRSLRGVGPQGVAAVQTVLAEHGMALRDA